MTTDPIDRIAERLQGVKPTARGITALCPAHDDHKPSLDVDRGDDGRALVTCRAGCQTSEVLGTIGMTMADLYADRKPVNGTAKPKPTKTPTIHETRERALSALLWSIRKKTEEGSYEIAKTYDYTDAAGAVVSVAVRIESPEAPKTFGQIRPEGNGWACGGPERPILYRLPEMIEAGPDSFVFVTEGEKDADRLAALGLVATCNPMGAGKWRGVDDEALRDRHLVIVPDNDEPGEAHAEQVADLTRSKAASVRVLNLPDLPHKGDVSDWLDAGGDVEAMVSLAENSPLWTPSEPEPEPEQPKAKRPTVANVDIVKAQGDDGEETTVTVARPPQDIAGDVFARVGPVYALGNRGLFTPEGEAVRMLGDDAAAFAWVKERASLYCPCDGSKTLAFRRNL